jgi:hypothetical protein
LTFRGGVEAVACRVSTAGPSATGGVTDAFVHGMPKANLKRSDREALTAVFSKWQTAVRQHYYLDE